MKSEMSMVMTNVMTIGKLAKAAAVGVETVRYYQPPACWPNRHRKGLIAITRMSICSN